MSKYEDYNNVSRNYDNQRFAMGSDVMAAMMQLHCGKPLKDIHVLDAGCGTGNYAKALIEYGVGHVTLLDASPGMLEKAKVKLADSIESGRVKEVVEATMPPIPFPDDSFDAVMFNLVLHHLDTTGSGSFSAATQSLKESVRVLRPGGIVILSTVLPSVISHAVWYAQINLALTERFNKIMPTMEQFDDMFESSHLSCKQKLNILGADLVKDYYNFEGPLDQAWRDAVSYWNFATPDELNDVKRKVRDLKQSGELEQWCKQHDNVTTSGFLTFLFCQPK
ncbi:malonyl-[acyl-carrier protein] O-methyltransferase-like isoform X2 [Ruditapes philippinarum]|uniref:malonyl-[acyl-carrier protein] O-methyltransferase-like isoform X2 n=1 Tax=Ruditapes philippinarum TaxID=129788 RepID=UPI00295B1445|nr:malonyl-[acyl-carrier protein] O-methyltransferase-like isoform X2 [Ruditapes philippinarum]